MGPQTGASEDRNGQRKWAAIKESIAAFDPASLRAADVPLTVSQLVEIAIEANPQSASIAQDVALGQGPPSP